LRRNFGCRRADLCIKEQQVMPDSIFGGNPYEICLGTGAANKTDGRAHARQDREGLALFLRTPGILQRLAELNRLPVTIEVRVRDTPLSGSSYTQRSRWLPADEIVTLCREDYYGDEYCLFDLLVARLPLDQWGSAEASLMNKNFDAWLFPDRYDLTTTGAERRSASRVEAAARERCHKVLREDILEIKSWPEVLRQGPEPDDIVAPWFNDRWRITLYRTLKLSN
jgi:hypothetical protein